MIWVGILGAGSYYREALGRLVAGHRSAQVSTVLDLQELGEAGSYMHCSKEAKPGYWSMVNAVKKSDVIFSGLTGKAAEELYSKAMTFGKRVIDIRNKHCGGSIFDGGSAYPGSVYGLSELYKDKMKGAAIVANPSSNCTGAILGLAPLAAFDMVDLDTAAIESKSGITCLERTDRLTDTGILDNSGAKIYKVESKGYAEEVNEQILALFGKSVSAAYEAYIIPGIKGITTSISVSPRKGIYDNDILDMYRKFYEGNPYIGVCDKEALMENGFGKSFCKIEASIDAGSGKVKVTTVLDDALRGIASQAIQSMNLMCGIDGKIGL